ncbi:phage portal protein family protein [Crenothrix polyspora]|uniref:Putative Mu-like prophage FluMu protein gp29 n=1 Tax=Crenothrix polyspora TaxID=360316 RepID=A0A1R4H146_9GAMM|nr:DUF935 family protein [Crenothrix polyspora]SJM89973.1 putative Mu-like prophage FluMu protein gp29 [Crenothrix polyspora]
MALNNTINPLLHLESATHIPATSVDAILSILTNAERGYIRQQADLFADMEERDAHIYAEITKRKMAVSELDWSLMPPDDAKATEKKAIAQLETRLRDTLDVNTLVFDMANAIGYGFAGLEIEWHKTTDLWLPKSITHRPQRWFTVDIETRRQLRLRNNTSHEGEELMPYGWIMHEHSSKTGSPATQGLYRALVLPYLFKNFATKNWLRFCELYGVPIRVLIHHETDPLVKKELYRALENMGQNGVAMLQGGLPEDLKTVPMTNGDGLAFKELIDWAERSISKAILGGTLTSDSGRNGNYATAAVHDDVRLKIRNNDAKQLSATLTKQLLGAIVALNGLSIRPAFAFDTSEQEDLKLYAEAIPRLVAAGVQIPESYAHTKLKIPYAVDGEPILKMASAVPADKPVSGTGLVAGAMHLAVANPTFTPEQQVIEELIKTAVDKGGNPVQYELISSVIKAASSPDDLANRLATVLATTQPDEFRTVLERALFAADVMGYVNG